MNNYVRKVIVITGASSGIGKAVALQLAKAGHRLILAGRNPETLQQVARACEKIGAEALTVRADVGSEADVRRLADQAIMRFGMFDVWINNAGVILYGRFLDVQPEEFQQVLQTNLLGTVYGSRAALNQFKSQGYGTLVNIGSGFGAVPAPYASSYITSKFAVRGLNASLAQELYADGERNIHVCSVLPATIDTPVYQHSGNRMERPPRAMPPVYAVDKAARKIARLVDRPKTEITIGGIVRLGTISYALFPALFLKVFSRYVKRFNYARNSDGASATNITEPQGGSATRGGWKNSTNLKQ